MGKTAEQKVRDRYAQDLRDGKQPRALTDTNRAILEEVRKEVEAGKRQVQTTTTRAVKRIREVKEESVQEIVKAKDQALCEIRAASAPVHAEREAEVEQEEDEAEEDEAAELPLVQQKEERPVVLHSDDEEKMQRLQSIVCQLQALSASTEVEDALARFAEEQLCAERDQLLMEWPQGARERRAMEVRARWQLEQQQKQSQKPDVGEGNEEGVTVNMVKHGPHLQVLDAYRDQFLQASRCAYEAIASLQGSAAEVLCERQAAQRERVGLTYLDGFQQAKKAFDAGFRQAARHSLVSSSWLRQCAERAGLSEDYLEWLGVRDSTASLGDLTWAPSSGMR